MYRKNVVSGYEKSHGLIARDPAVASYCQQREWFASVIIPEIRGCWFQLHQYVCERVLLKSDIKGRNSSDIETFFPLQSLLIPPSLLLTCICLHGGIIPSNIFIFDANHCGAHSHKKLRGNFGKGCFPEIYGGFIRGTRSYIILRGRGRIEK